MHGLAMAELDWDDLRYFLRALQARTLAGAARTMGVEHTTVGRRLAALERALGVSLVVRGPSGLTPTVVGTQVLASVEQLARQIDALQAEVAGRSACVRVVVPSGFAQIFVGTIAALREREPPVSIELLSGSRPVDLVRGEADVAVRVGPIAHDELVARRVAEVGWALYATAGYLADRDLDVADLRGHAVIGFDTALAAMPAAKWLAARTQPTDVVLRGREMTDMLAAALAGLGLAVLPCHLGDAEPALVRLTAEAVATRELSLVYRRESSRVPHVRAVIDAMAQSLRAQADRLGGTRPR